MVNKLLRCFFSEADDGDMEELSQDDHTSHIGLDVDKGKSSKYSIKALPLLINTF